MRKSKEFKFICNFCGGEEFLPATKRNLNKKTCSVECRMALMNKPKIENKGKRDCVICGKEFFTPPSTAIKTCSEECSSILRSQNTKGEKNAMFKHGKHTLRKQQCENCGKIFEKKEERKYCGVQCANEHLFKGKTKELAKRIEKECLCCKKTFRVKESEKHRQYCNQNCWTKSQTKEKNPYWREGIAVYRKYYLKENEEICNMCGTDKKIEIHHIDRNRRNNDMNNLISLCSSCHTALHMNKKFIVNDIGLNTEKIEKVKQLQKEGFYL